MKTRTLYLTILLTVLVLTPAISRDNDAVSDSVLRQKITANASDLFNGSWFIKTTGYDKKDSTTIDTIFIYHKNKKIRLVADRFLSRFPARLPVIDSLEKGLLAGCGEPGVSYAMEIYSAGKNIRDYVPNYYRQQAKDYDRARTIKKFRRTGEPLVKNLSRPYLSETALYNKNIALWHSHGWYYESSLHRWEWQRARLFQTVEDLFPMAFTLQMLVPMLENAGASVFLPRERDWQNNEVIVDNDGSSGRSIYTSTDPDQNGNMTGGFGIGSPPYVDENPFRLGSWQKMKAAREATGSVQWIPDIPDSGEYAVYISYHSLKESADDARYRVYHEGGTTDFSVNQQMGGGTWVYLGRFSFREGLNPEQGRVRLINTSKNRKAIITADAVRFGGGMGNIAREGLTGKRPRYQEAARYYLQYAGFPDSLVWSLNGPGQDYKDDYQGRGEWVSYLMEKSPGLGIPVDLSFAFHTDAGIAGSDTVIGSLGIFSTRYRKGAYPGGLSRMSSRDLADLIQSEVVENIRQLYYPDWVRRGLWDQAYSEAFRPDVPSMMLELLSHQNFLDVRFGQEPMFRFHVSRAIYKGMLRFLSSLQGGDFVVQPLPVNHLKTELLEGDGIRLSWKAVSDPLEPTANPESYRVYTSINGEGFDQGVDLEEMSFTLEEVHPDSIYSFRVTALNAGGESFPSEVVSACRSSENKGQVLMISAFDRTGGAAWFEDSAYAGFLPMVDHGVPWQKDLHTVGAQYDYLKSSPWLDDDSPGHGASYADLEGVIIPGNSFDFPEKHGFSIARAGYSFATISDEAFEKDSINLKTYDVIDFIAGEEKSTWLTKDKTFPSYQVLSDSMLRRLGSYLDDGGSLFISGAHIATDIHINRQDSIVASLLKYKWRTSNASRSGAFYFMNPDFGAYSETYHFNSGIDAEIYTVEGADALEPAQPDAATLIRYRDSNASAAVAYRGDYRLIAMGFPFETILEPEVRDGLMAEILNFLTQNE